MISALRSLLERRARPIPDRIRRPILALTTVGLVVAAVWAWRSADLAASDLRWAPILGLALLAAPLSLLLKAAEFAVAARIAGQRPSRRLATETAVVSSAANLLPLPGSLLVTVQTLAERGATYGGAVAASAVPGIAWIGATGVVGGIAIAVEGSAVLAATVIAMGAVALLGAGAMFLATAPASGRVPLAAAVLAVEIAWLATSGLRFVLAASAIGLDLTFTQALVLSVAGAASVAIGFVPGGLGVREGLIAALSPLIGLDVDQGLVLGVIDRVVWLGFLGLAAVALTLTRRSAEA
ncbi:MAG: lysylphosphatidylglycerol synthase domain-containing protein [Actinomycetota bacterium]